MQDSGPTVLMLIEQRDRVYRKASAASAVLVLYSEPLTAHPLLIGHVRAVHAVSIIVSMMTGKRFSRGQAVQMQGHISVPGRSGTVRRHCLLCFYLVQIKGKREKGGGRNNRGTR